MLWLAKDITFEDLVVESLADIVNLSDDGLLICHCSCLCLVENGSYPTKRGCSAGDISKCYVSWYASSEWLEVTQLKHVATFSFHQDHIWLASCQKSPISEKESFQQEIHRRSNSPHQS